MELHNEPMEIVMSEESLARVRHLIGSLGLYDASQDDYLNPDHDDSKWIVRSVD